MRAASHRPELLLPSSALGEQGLIATFRLTLKIIVASLVASFVASCVYEETEK